MKDPALPLVEELPGKPDAWGAFLRTAHLPGVLYLDSALGGGPLARYSFVAGDPFAKLRERLREFGGAPGAGAGRLVSDAGLEALPPFRGGAAGLLGYGL